MQRWSDASTFQHRHDLFFVSQIVGDGGRVVGRVSAFNYETIAQRILNHVIGSRVREPNFFQR
jgi:hypothetical protein